MDSAFRWLQEIFDYVLLFIPKIIHIDKLHGGVKFVRGKDPRELKPGLYLYWPVTTRVYTLPIVRQALIVKPQVILTKDEKSVVASALIVYEIGDFLKALTSVWDLDETIKEITQASVPKIIIGHTLKELIDEMGNGGGSLLDKQLTELTRSNLEEFGVRVLYSSFTYFSICNVISLVGNNDVTTVVPVSGLP